jgi:hypothetical protein
MNHLQCYTLHLVNIIIDFVVVFAMKARQMGNPVDIVDLFKKFSWTLFRLKYCPNQQDRPMNRYTLVHLVLLSPLSPFIQDEFWTIVHSPLTAKKQLILHHKSNNHSGLYYWLWINLHTMSHERRASRTGQICPDQSNTYDTTPIPLKVPAYNLNIKLLSSQPKTNQCLITASEKFLRHP